MLRRLRYAHRIRDEVETARQQTKTAVRTFIENRIVWSQDQKVPVIRTMKATVECAAGCLASLSSRKAAAEVLEDIARRLKRRERIDF